MVTNTLNARLMVAAKTASAWDSYSVVPLAGELCLETDTLKFKFGNGVDTYDNLKYVNDLPKILLDGVEKFTTLPNTSTNGTYARDINFTAGVDDSPISNPEDGDDYEEHTYIDISVNPTTHTITIGTDGIDDAIAAAIAAAVPDVQGGNKITATVSGTTVTLDHDTTTVTETTGSTDLAGGDAVITDVDYDSYGHITGFTTQPLPDNLTSIAEHTESATSGYVVTGVTTEDGGVTDVDEVAYEDIAPVQDVAGGNHITVNAVDNTYTVNHDAVGTGSAVSSSADSTTPNTGWGGSVITEVDADSYGHVSGTKTRTLPSNPVSAPGESSSGAGDSTAGQLMKSDGDDTTSPSGFTASNGTITASGSANATTLPSVRAVIEYVTGQTSQAMHYKGTVSAYSQLPTSASTPAPEVGDVYVASASFYQDPSDPTSAHYETGDYFIWNGTGWDVVTGENQVTNNDTLLSFTLDSGESGSHQQTIATVDGTAITVRTPELAFSDPSASGNGLTFIDTVSQSNGVISATKKTVQDGTTSQKGVVQLMSSHDGTENAKAATGVTVKGAIDERFVADIHNATDTDKYASAKQTWDEFEKRNVQFVEMESIDTIIHSLTEQDFINNYAYGVRWIQGTRSCDWVGAELALHTMPVHNSFRACVYQINPVTNGFDVTETIDGVDYTVHYGARREFLYWLDDDDWTKKSDGTASVINGTGNTGVAIYHDRFYGKSFEGITYNGRSDYNAVYVSPIQYDETWVEIKEGFVDFAKATIVSGKARCYTGATPTVSRARKAMHAAALESGGHMMSYDEYKWIFYWLPVIEFGTFQVESNTVPSTWSWGSDVVNRASLTGDDIPAYGYPMLYSSSTLGYNYITSGFTNALGTHTGWVKYTNANYSANVLPAARWRGFEIQRCNWTNVQGCWGEQTSSPNTIFATKNRALFSAYISSGNTEKHCIVNLDGSELANVTSAINNETWALDSTDNLWKSTTYKVRDQHIRYVGKQVGGGVIGEFTINSLGDMIPKTIADKKYDDSYTRASFSETYLYNPRFLCFGGRASGGSSGGPGNLDSRYVASAPDADFAFRVCWNIDEYTSVMN